MNILIATQTYWPDANGQAVFTTHLAKGLVQNGHRVLVLMPASGWKSATAHHNGVEIRFVSAFTLPWYDTVRLTPLPQIAVRRTLDTFQPDLVHVQDHYFLAASMVSAALRRGIPVLGTNHFLPANLSRNLPLPDERLLPWVEHVFWAHMLWVYNRLDLITTPTATAAEILKRQRVVPPVIPISCGVDTHRFRPHPDADRPAMRRKYGLAAQKAIFLFVGRVDHEKRLDVLLRAAAQVRRDDFQIAIAGKGLHAESLKALAARLGLGERVKFLGYVPDEDLPALLNTANVFAMPSEAELQSIATLEAMASGLPVLAARAKALPELVEDGINGYLFAPGQPEDAARRMTRLLEERPHWAEMGRASRRMALAHSLPNTVRRYETAYRTAMTAHIRHAWARPQRSKQKKQWMTAWWKK